MVSGTFNSPKRGAFHLSLALLFTIGRGVVLSLGGWAPHVHTEFHGIHATHKAMAIRFRCRIRDYHPILCDFPDTSASDTAPDHRGLVRFRSPLLTESRLISFPTGTEMFQFPAFASTTYEFSRR